MEGSLQSKVRSMLLANVERGYSKVLKSEYCYIKPSPGPYPYQWWWDTFFHVFILCSIGEIYLAKDNLRSLFAMQEEDGFVGHIIYWQKIMPAQARNVLHSRPTFRQPRPKMSTLIQPAFIAQSLIRIWEETGDRDFLNEMLPKVIKYFDWLKENRDFDGDNLLTIINTLESGMDSSPVYDPVFNFKGKANKKLWRRMLWIDVRNFLNYYNLRSINRQGYFKVKDTVINTLYSLDLFSLAELCDIAGDKNNAERYKKRAKAVAKAIKKKMYDRQEHAFFNLYGIDDKKIKIMTPTIFYPLVLNILSEKEANVMLQKHYIKSEYFRTDYPMPSVSTKEPSFDPTESPYLWRGPTWIVNNWFMYRCLVTRGFNYEANELLESVKNLINKSGFREYYNPFSGAGYGAPDFTWSGLVVDMIRMEEKEKRKNYQSLP